MSDVHASPGRLERWLLAIPDGAVLRLIFFGLLTLGATILWQDFQAGLEAGRDAARTERTQPMPLAPARPGDQLRPYLPRALPVAPDRGVPRIPGFSEPLDGGALAASMRFERVADGELAAVGRIDPGTAERLRAALKGAGGEGVTRLVLHSPGGSVEDALAMARLLRERGLETRVPADGYCASACPLVFAGGTARAAGEGAWIGVHQVYAADPSAALRDIDRSIGDIQTTTARCQQLLVDMGVDPRVWIHAMETPAAELYVLTPDELREFKLVWDESQAEREAG
ncbi:hypothetical protein [Aureimonas jatrophae]|uniref:Clp protease n=1 Tax=Aureimonas jatrophae TaxID=1166073 RepID=A0A1H0CBA7_9HYPH|nr:hypothetical protein [Aureimonas jatrophae]MBB3949157.1 hypothetical protein [Aureimonas jatrophae]SDN55168.1 hypothetical protein SAMN05192530_101229 [Aureimonas jatrophae]